MWRIYNPLEERAVASHLAVVNLVCIGISAPGEGGGGGGYALRLEVGGFGMVGVVEADGAAGSCAVGDRTCKVGGPVG